MERNVSFQCTVGQDSPIGKKIDYQEHFIVSHVTELHLSNKKKEKKLKQISN
jgi:hypothetical protein